MRATLWLTGERDDLLAGDRIAALGATPPHARAYADRTALARDLDATDARRARVAAFCARHHLAVEAHGFRTLVTSGTIGAYERAFGTTMATYVHGEGPPFRRRTTALQAPDEIAADVRGVLGLDAWPHPRARAPAAAPAGGSERGFLAAQTCAHYGFADAWTGRGETIGILRYGGRFDDDDLQAALRAHGASAPPVACVAVDGASLGGHHDAQFDGELALDVQVVAAHAPGAHVVLVTAPHDERGLLDALATTILDPARSISIFTISFGYPEDRWTHAALARFDELAAVAALAGVTLLAASGDGGALVDEHGVAHVNAPASNRYVLACGGTVLATSGDETAWPHAGGGFSARAAAPPWQRDALATIAAPDATEPYHRYGVPDVAAQVDPGYRMVYGGATTFTTGTSAIAPLWAAFVARTNERLGARAGFFAPLLYAGGIEARPPLRAIVGGGNDRYEARGRWSAVTGLGIPDGDALFARLRDGA